MFDVKVVEDSVNTATGDRLTTIEATYPRIIHEEVLTHAALSLVTASSRAVPTRVWVDSLQQEPFIPGFWGQNTSGMVSGQEIPLRDQELALKEWLTFRDDSVKALVRLNDLGVHKQLANRPPHALTMITSVISGTEWNNLFGLRYHEAAQPEFQCLAAIIWDEYNFSTPVSRKPGEWHLPYITEEERQREDNKYTLALQSTARCGRVSYFRQGQVFDKMNEINRANSFIAQGHWSTAEFAAVAQPASERHGNLTGWRPVRKFFAGESIAQFNPPAELPGRYEQIRKDHRERRHGK
jgi:hypothetical protein